ncbi:MAG: DUF1232 domain-containing protein [Elusimicrobiaceae bacterium]|nr:DUF1232 domain-containing protein [Elusimicrobiaceae bacterium]
MNDFKTFFSMMRAVLQRRYPMPWKTFFVALFCVFYLFSPVDLLPDIMPLLGITDDATFVLLVLALIKQDLNKFKQTTSLKPPKEDVIDAGDIKDHKK